MLSIPLIRNSPISILCIGAHCDDIEIGCGGTLLKILGENEGVSITWAVLCTTPKREKEARESAKHFLKNATQVQIITKKFRDGFLPYSGHKPKEYFEELKENINPDVIFTHCRHDLHQDHRLINELTWNTFRNNLIFEYEIPKYDADLGSPNVFVCLDPKFCEEKIKTILKSYHSQKSKPWFTKDTFYSLLRLRGLESRSPSKFAEAFYCRKMILK